MILYVSSQCRMKSEMPGEYVFSVEKFVVGGLSGLINNNKESPLKTGPAKGQKGPVRHRRYLSAKGQKGPVRHRRYLPYSM